MKVQLNARNRAHHFESNAEDKLLYAGLSNAVDLPYECGSGTCGTCKARLLSGDIEDRWPEAPGRKFLKEGEFLLCQCEARSDLSLEVAAFVHTMEAGASVPQHYSGRIVEAKKLTRDVLFLVVGLDRPMDFDAGQFVMAKAGPVAGYRGWSMVNYARKSDRLEFVVKNKIGGGISEWLFKSVLEGETLDLFGPLGKATFFPALARNVLCIAGGSGIAGMMSILSRAAHDGYFTQYRGDVFFGVRTLDDAFFLDEFTDLVKRCGDKLSITVALSDEPVPDDAARRCPQLKFDQGLVHEVAGKQMAGKFQNVRAYLAGPTPAVDASIRMLLQSKVSTDNIRYDKFS
ncbi:MAG: 2Fe-2S iron-sulfur cluster binding domain-containing protein [Caldimonas sp.]